MRSLLVLDKYYDKWWTPKYQAIADDLRRRVAAGEFAAGRLLPSEAELGGAYAASRMTVREALEVLREEGLVDSRQGFGWFVAAPPLDQSLGRLGTIEAQLAESGRRSERRVLDFGFVAAPAAACAGCSAPTGCSRSGGSTSSTGCRSPGSRCGAPPALAAHLSLADVERATFHDLLDVELAGATQTISADAVGAADAECSACPAARRRWSCERVTRSVDGDAGPAVGARVPRAPHPVRGRAGQRRPVGGAQRPPPGA